MLTLRRFSSTPEAYLISITCVVWFKNAPIVFVPSRGISNLNKQNTLYRHGLHAVFVPSRGISNLNIEKPVGKSRYLAFSSPPGAYLISIEHAGSEHTIFHVFVPSRGIFNLNNIIGIRNYIMFHLFSSPPGAYLISMELLLIR